MQTYCIDKQTPDSACAATAFLSGVKTNVGTINVSPKVKRGDCTVPAADRLESIAKAALDAGKVVGKRENVFGVLGLGFEDDDPMLDFFCHGFLVCQNIRLNKI